MQLNIKPHNKWSLVKLIMFSVSEETCIYLLSARTSSELLSNWFT